ncbi:MAG: ABC transporter ATP-binding protein [Thermodesulfobacteriota bacterium]
MVTRIENISKIYSNGRAEPLEALSKVSLDVGPQEFLCLVGPSGCGKSTLLTIVAGLMEPSSGRVWFEGSYASRPPTGMVFQDLALFPWRTVAGNVAYGLEEMGLPRTQRRARVRELLAKVGLAGFEDRYPHELSGGMRQRAAIARALAPEPALLLMDEPLSSLDAQTREEMQMELCRLYEGGSELSFLYVTHDVGEAVFLADRVVLMSPRPGRILETIEVNLPRPRDEATRGCAEFHALVESIGARLRREAL